MFEDGRNVHAGLSDAFHMTSQISGLEIKIFFREPNCILKSYQNVLCIETSTFLGTLQKFEGDAAEFKGALGSWHP